MKTNSREKWDKSSEAQLVIYKIVGVVGVVVLASVVAMAQPPSTFSATRASRRRRSVRTT